MKGHELAHALELRALYGDRLLIVCPDEAHAAPWRALGFNVMVGHEADGGKRPTGVIFDDISIGFVERATSAPEPRGLVTPYLDHARPVAGRAFDWRGVQSRGWRGRAGRFTGR